MNSEKLGMNSEFETKHPLNTAPPSSSHSFHPHPSKSTHCSSALSTSHLSLSITKGKRTEGHVRRSILLQPPCAISQFVTTDLTVEPDKRIQPSGGGGAMEPSGFGKRLMSVLRAVYHMLRRGLCRKRLMMDLHLLLGRGKLAGRALRNLVAAAHHHPHASAAHHVVSAARRHGAAAASSADAAPTDDLPFAPNPRDVEFSCTTTPSYDFAAPARAMFPFGLGRFRGRGARRGCDGLDFAQVARALEMMSAADANAGAGGEMPSAAAAGATPSPMLALRLGRSPAGVRQLRVTDSPFPLEPEGVVDERANSNFDAFINRFYENLRLQAANATPDNCARRRA